MVKMVKIGVYHSLYKTVSLRNDTDSWTIVHPNLKGLVMDILSRFGQVYFQRQPDVVKTDENGEKSLIPSGYFDIYVENPRWGASEYSDHNDTEIKFFRNAIMERVFDTLPKNRPDLSKVKMIESE